MIKECIVKLNNDAVTVVSYDGIDVQFPSIHRDAKTVRVKYTNGRYCVVSDDYKESEQDTIPAKSKKKSFKKTTIDDAMGAEEIFIEESADSK